MHKTPIKQKLGDNNETLCIVCVNLVQKKRLYKIDNTTEHYFQSMGALTLTAVFCAKTAIISYKRWTKNVKISMNFVKKSLLRSKPKRMASSPAETRRLLPTLKCTPSKIIQKVKNHCRAFSCSRQIKF